MSIFDWFGDLFSDDSDDFDSSSSPCLEVETIDVNPATGLMMFGGTCGLDTAGNPYGVDLHFQSTSGSIDVCGCGIDECSSTSLFDQSPDMGFSDDSFGHFTSWDD